MPRPIRQHVIGPPGATLADMRANLQPNINLLLSLANQGHALVDRVLLAVSEGRRNVTLPGPWPEPLVFAVVSVMSNVRSGDYHLRRCIDCANWMLVKNSNRLICPTCRKRRAAKKEVRRRRVEREADRRALEAVRPKRA